MEKNFKKLNKISKDNFACSCSFVRSNVRKNLLCKMKFAYTMTEVMVAVAIVVIIAAMVVSSVLRHYRQFVFDEALRTTIFSVNDSLRKFAKEGDNESQIKAAQKDQSENGKILSYQISEKFLKENFQIAKFCGLDTVKCMGHPEFYTKNGRKQVALRYLHRDENVKSILKWEFSPTENSSRTYPWTCATFKNGQNLCLNFNDSTIYQVPLAIVDLNGRKGPNIFGRDVRMFRLDTKLIPYSDLNEKEILSFKGVLVACPFEPSLTEGADYQCCGAYPYKCNSSTSEKNCFDNKVSTNFWDGVSDRKSVV